LSIAVSGTTLFAGTNGGVFLSTNNGTSWTAANAGLGDQEVSAFAINGPNLFAGTGGGVYRSTDSGTSWTSLGTLLGYSVRCLAVSGVILLKGTIGSRGGGGISLSTNSGMSWTAAWGNSPVLCFAVSGTNIFAGIYGVCVSTNSGTSWAFASTGLTDTTVYALAVSATNLYAGTLGGVWRRPLSEMIQTSVRTTADELPSTFRLRQNYPNPFNPSTTIKFELPKSSVVRLSVYDLLGREVSVLVNERTDAGVYEVKFDGSALASGVYFYRMQAGSFVQTKTFLLLR
jgi:hypothetical protein